MLLVSIVIFFIQSLIQLSETPIKENAVEFEEIAMIDGGELGFYQYVTVKVASNGNLVVYDNGNHIVHIYNKKGEEDLQFGQEGNGPMEFSRESSLIHVSDVIVFYRSLKYAFFDMQGNFIKTAKIESNHFYSGYAINKKNSIIIDYQQVPDYKFKSIEISKQGEIIKTNLNTDQDKYKGLDQNEREYQLLLSVSKNPRLNPYDSQRYLSTSLGEFKITIYDYELKPISFLTYPMNRVKRDMSKSNIRITRNGQRDIIAEKKYMDNFNKVHGIYKSDISSYNGSHNGYIFVTLVREDGEDSKTLVISPDFKTYTTISFNNNDIQEWKVNDEYMFASFKNDEIGPFVKIYGIKFK